MKIRTQVFEFVPPTLRGRLAKRLGVGLGQMSLAFADAPDFLPNREWIFGALWRCFCCSRTRADPAYFCNKCWLLFFPYM
jgi:hypothetical protein